MQVKELQTECQYQHQQRLSEAALRQADQQKHEQLLQERENSAKQREEVLRLRLQQQQQLLEQQKQQYEERQRQQEMASTRTIAGNKPALFLARFTLSWCRTFVLLTRSV